MPRRWMEGVNRVLGRAEVKGYHWANKIHLWSVNALLVFIGYTTYSIFRDYNSYHLQKRQRELEEKQLENSLKVNS